MNLIFSISFLFLSVQPSYAEASDTQKAATAYWKAACDVKYGHIGKYEAGDKTIEYMIELGVNPVDAYNDHGATKMAEWLDKKAGTNFFR